MSKTSRRTRRRSRRARFIARLTRKTVFGCITCAFEALTTGGGFRCATHGPMSGERREAWRRAHPGYARAADEDDRRAQEYMRRNGRA